MKLQLFAITQNVMSVFSISYKFVWHPFEKSKFPRNFYFVYNYLFQAIQYVKDFIPLEYFFFTLCFIDRYRKSGKSDFCTSKCSYTYTSFCKTHLKKFTLKFVRNVYRKQTNQPHSICDK